MPGPYFSWTRRTLAGFAYQEIDHRGPFSAVTKFSTPVTSADDLSIFLRQAFREATTGTPGPTHLRDDLELVADTFRRFGEDKIAPQAEHIHREDLRG